MKQSHIEDCIEQGLPSPRPYIYKFQGSGPAGISITIDSPKLDVISTHFAEVGDWPATDIRISLTVGTNHLLIVAYQPFGVDWVFGVISRSDGTFPATIEITAKDYISILTITSPTPLEISHG